jgi:sporulation protein YlmC with PRC-barrel domain
MSIPQHAWQDIEGMDVFTSDEEQVGTVEQVWIDESDPTMHYLRIRAAALLEVLGTEDLYVPESDIERIEEDRVVLDTPASAINRPDWTMPPEGYMPPVGA